MASNNNIECSLVAEIDVKQEIAIAEEVIEAEVIVVTDEAAVIPRIEVELGITQWSLVSDAIFIKNVTGEEPAWFLDMIDDAIRNNDDLIAEFDDIQGYIDALEAGYTNLVSVTDTHTSQISALKVSDAENTAAITVLNDVKITEKQASAISNETITAWMRGGESAAWFNSHVQAVATDTASNTKAIINLGAEVDGISAGVTEISEALVEKYENPEWDGTTDPDPAGEPKWIYKARAKHSLEVNANGSISGFIADAVSGPEGERSSFKIYADEFLICDKVDSAGQPGTTAFLVKFQDNGNPPKIMLNGDVYFGDIPEYANEEYSLFDIALDSVVDPVEKTALEKSYGELSDRDLTFQSLIYAIDGRYNELTVTHSAATSAYTAAFLSVTNLMDDLGIRGVSLTPEDPYLPTDLSTITLDRDSFNAIYFEYDSAYTILNGLMSDLVKKVADDSYNIMVGILEDNIISASEKQQLNVYLSQIEATYQNILPTITQPDCTLYPGKGFEEFSRYGVIFNSFSTYESSMYATVGGINDPTCPCVPNPCPDEYYLISGIVTQMALPQYDLVNDTIDTIISESDATAALASTRWFVDARADYNQAVAGTTIDTTFIKIVNETDPDVYTLITNDTVSTGEVGEHDYFVDDVTRDTSKNYNNYKTGTMNVTKKPIGGDPVMFRIDSEIDQSVHDFLGICNSENNSNIRTHFIESAIGSFAELYSGDIVAIANGIHRVKDHVIKSVEVAVAMYDLMDETIIMDSTRFYSPTNPDITPETNDNRIRKFGASMFTATMTGGFLDRKSDIDIMQIRMTLEYNADDMGWASAPNQIAGLTNSQTVMLSAPMCVNHVDFRVVAKATSRGMLNVYKKINYTIMLKN